MSWDATAVAGWCVFKGLEGVAEVLIRVRVRKQLSLRNCKMDFVVGFDDVFFSSSSASRFPRNSGVDDENLSQKWVFYDCSPLARLD